jgi:transcriptional regulator with XRE-family HTH domain
MIDGMSETSETTALQEFGAFLRSRPERLAPADVGLPTGVRRRTPGLRREEVALLAGVGATWYTWLEQGRDVQASAEVLGAIAGALRLQPHERQHLFQLAGRPLPQPVTHGPESVDEALLRMLDSLAQQPAYVMGRRWDILAWNDAAVALFGDYGRLEGDDRNALSLLFANPAHRRLLVDWAELAPRSAAMFRADSARYAGDQEFERLIVKLAAASSDFRHWWAARDVLPPLAGNKRIRHPDLGLMSFEFTSFAVLGGQDLKLVVYTPLVADDTQAKLRALLAATTSDAAPR